MVFAKVMVGDVASVGDSAAAACAVDALKIDDGILGALDVRVLGALV